MKKRTFGLLVLVLLLDQVIGMAASSGAGSKGDVWTDSKSGLMWQVKPTGGMMGWEKAKSHCKNLTLGGYSDWRLPTISELRSLIRGCPSTGGYSDWRLPTISELRSLIRGCPSTMLGGSCKGTDSCEGCTEGGGPGKGGFGGFSQRYWPLALSGDGVWFWSSSVVAGRTTSKWAKGVWVVDFYKGGIGGHLANYWTNDVRCVRGTFRDQP